MSPRGKRGNKLLQFPNGDDNLLRMNCQRLRFAKPYLMVGRRVGIMPPRPLPPVGG